MFDDVLSLDVICLIDLLVVKSVGVIWLDKFVKFKLTNYIVVYIKMI